MRNLTKKQKDELDDIIKRLQDEAIGVQGMVTGVNRQIDELNGYIQNYNDLVAEANQFRAEIADAIEEDMEEKSDKWRESDEGEAQTQFHDEWQGELETADEFDTLDIELNQADELQAIPEST